MEAAVRWVYSIDKKLPEPWQENLGTLVNEYEFKELVGIDIIRRLNYIRITGNNAVHNANITITPDQAKLSLYNLFIFLDFIAFHYADTYTKHTFDETLLTKKPELEIKPAPSVTPQHATQEQTKESPEKEETLKQLIARNQLLVEELTARREARDKTYVPEPLNISEYQTRKLYIDTMLQDVGWILGKDCVEELELHGMPNKKGVGYADYVLFGDDGKPLAVIEAKKTCKDVSEGRHQAQLYAELLQKKYGTYPTIFLTNGFETRIIEQNYPERPVSFIYAKKDLQHQHYKHLHKTPLTNITINPKITDRYYQKNSILAVCEEFQQNKRKALLVMATGSGKTRTVISLIDILSKHNWVKNVLFLADRNALIRQAKRAFATNLPTLTAVNLGEENRKKPITARAVFSTYQTMINAIDDTKDEDGKKLFTPGHFDIIIVDEAHRSIYNKYKDIFTYFDAHIVGLTATPKEDIDKNTYEIFELENGIPTSGYDLEQAVADGHLVDFVTIESAFKFIQEGIAYNDLSEEEKEEYERYFTDEDGNIPESINPSALNDWVFNEDTIKQVLAIVMENAIRIEHGSKIGKTIIFAKNHKHAEKIYEVFGKQYPSYPPGYCQVIDNRINYAEDLIDEFSKPNALPQIAISVDMLDTGIDVPEILNLVFFKKVLSKAKFWQMIGRGTRLCPGLLDGEDKTEFYIFDFCGNFEFFRVCSKGKEPAVQKSVQERIFNLKTEIIYQLQDIAFVDNKEFMEYRADLIQDNVRKIQALNKENTMVRQHLRYVELYSEEQAFAGLTYENTLDLEEHIAPLILPESDESSAVFFDSLLYALELANLQGVDDKRHKRDLRIKISALTKITTIPEITKKSAIIKSVLTPGYLDIAEITDFEHIRTELRSLMKYIENTSRGSYSTHFEDEYRGTIWNVSDDKNTYLTDFQKKEYIEAVTRHIKDHEKEPAITKLKTNIPLNQDDIERLEEILWKELGSKEEYDCVTDNKPLGVFVRSIVGLDMNAAKAAFSEFLTDENLNAQQRYFVNKIVEYIAKNGLLTDRTILTASPFTDRGGVGEIFDIKLWSEICNAIKKINRNAGYGS